MRRTMSDLESEEIIDVAEDENIEEIEEIEEIDEDVFEYDDEEVIEDVQEEVVEEEQEEQVEAPINDNVQVSKKILEEAEKLSEIVSKDALVKQIVTYRKKGFSDSEIISGLHELEKQAKAKEEEEEPFVYTGDEAIAEYVQKKIDKAVAPLMKELEIQKNNELYRRVADQNDRQLTAALTSAGATQIPAGFGEKMNEVLSDLYPGVHLAGLALTPKQADVIVKTTLAELNWKPQMEKKNSVKSSVRSAQAPKVVGGNRPKSDDSEPRPARKKVTQQARLDRWKSIS